MGWRENGREWFAKVLFQDLKTASLVSMLREWTIRKASEMTEAQVYMVGEAAKLLGYPRHRVKKAFDRISHGGTVKAVGGSGSVRLISSGWLDMIREEIERCDALPQCQPKAEKKRDYLTPPMLAKESGISVVKIRRLIEKGEIKASDISEGGSRKRYLVHRDAFAEFLKTREVVAPPEPPRRGRPRRAAADEGVTKYY